MFKERNTAYNITTYVCLNGVQEEFFIRDLTFQQSTPASLNTAGVMMVNACLLGSIFVGTYFKYALYQYMYDNRKEIRTKPIDFLILIQALIDHFGCIWITLTYTIGLTFNITFSNVFGDIWCQVTYYTGLFQVVYRPIASLGIAILRLFYIKCTYLIRNIAFRIRLMITVLISGVVFAAILAVVFGSGNGPASRKQVMWNFCTGTSTGFRENVHNYSVLRGGTVPRSELMTKMVVGIGIAAVVGELVCYILFFRHLYSHDEELLKKKVIKVSEARKRHRRNSSTFIGQFHVFLVRCAIGILIAYTLTENASEHSRWWTAICLLSEFGILSVVEVMTSYGLRQNLPPQSLSFED